MPSTPLTCSSMGTPTVSRTVWAFAPGYCAVTSTVGGVISGYWSTGSVKTATPPASTKTIDKTEAKMGRSMKKCEITRVPLHAAARSEFGVVPDGLLAVAAQNHEGAKNRAGHGDSHLPCQRPARQPRQQKADGESQHRARGRRADEPDGTGREEPCLTQSLEDVEEDWRQEDAEQGHPQHAAENRRPQRPPHLRAGPSGEDQRDDPQDKGERSHQDRAKSQARRLDCRLIARLALLMQLPGELHDQDGVLARQPDQHHQADLHKDIDVFVGQEHAGGPNTGGTRGPPG